VTITCHLSDHRMTSKTFRFYRAVSVCQLRLALFVSIASMAVSLAPCHFTNDKLRRETPFDTWLESYGLDNRQHSHTMSQYKEPSYTERSLVYRVAESWSRSGIMIMIINVIRNAIEMMWGKVSGRTSFVTNRG